MTVYALKHKKSGKYVAAAVGQLAPTMQWNGNTKNVQFHLTDDLLKSIQIQDPDMDMVYKFGLEPVPLKISQATLEKAYNIYEHE